LGKKEYIKYLKANKGNKYDCKSSYDILSHDGKVCAAKVTMAFDNFTRVDYITLNQGKDGALHVVKDNALHVFDLDAANEEFSYDGQGRIIRYKRTAATTYDESYTIAYDYDESGITETYTNEEYNERNVRRYTFGSDNMIVSSTMVENDFDTERTVTYEYDGQGYLLKKHVRTEDRNEIYETILLYTYEDGNLITIDQDMNGDGRQIYTTNITYTKQPQKAFIFHNGYPVLQEQYDPLQRYFGKPSKNTIASIREFLGFGYANYQYSYRQNEHGFVERVEKKTDSNQGQEFIMTYVLNCR